MPQLISASADTVCDTAAGPSILRCQVQRFMFLQRVVCNLVAVRRGFADAQGDGY